jgi:hypothetical protein
MDGGDHMSDRIKWIDRNGKKVLYIDFSSLVGAELIKLIKEVDVTYEGQQPKSLLIFFDYTDAYGNEEAMAELKKLSKKSDIYVKKGAASGITGIKKILANAINTFVKTPFKLFDDKEKALAWLTED